MSLDELQKWAEDWRREMPLDRHPSFAADTLARALLVLLPVVHAAEAVVGPLCIVDPNSEPAWNDLVNAINTARSAMGRV